VIRHTAQSVEDILRTALRMADEDERRNVRPGVRVQYFFRGENQNYQDLAHDRYPSCALKPGVYREPPERLKNETWYLNEASRLFPEEFSNDHTTFERLTRLQHYGFPTRLADITQNVFVAAAFACMPGRVDKSSMRRMGFVRVYRVREDRIKYSTGDMVTALSKLAVLAADKIKLKNLQGLAYEVKGERPGFYWADPRKDDTSRRLVDEIQKVWCVRPVMNNSRIKMQDGAFLLFGCGEGKKCLQASFEEADFDNTEASTFGIAQVATIGIPPKVKESFRGVKRYIGVDDQRIYPDLENLAESLKGR